LALAIPFTTQCSHHSNNPSRVPDVSYPAFKTVRVKYLQLGLRLVLMLGLAVRVRVLVLELGLGSRLGPGLETSEV